MLPIISMFDRHGNFAAELFQQQARKIRNARNVITKGQELDRLEEYFKYLAQLKDPHDPAMVELWRSGLFEEVVDILSTPMSSDLKGHLTLYHIALLTLNDIVRSPWTHNAGAKVYLKPRGPTILRVQSSAYRLPMPLDEELQFKFRDPLIGIFEILLNKLNAPGDLSFQDSLDCDILLGLVFDYYFGLTPPTQAKYSASGSRVILFHYSEEAFRSTTGPFLKEVLARRGEKHVVDRYAELARKAGPGQVLDTESLWNLLTHLLTVQSLHKRLLSEFKVHVWGMRTFWKEPRSFPGEPAWSEDVAQKISFPIAYIVAFVGTSLRPSFVQDLIENDLILLFGRALFGTEVSIWLRQVPQIFPHVDIYGHIRRHAQSNIAQPQWAHVWRSLNSVQRSTLGYPSSTAWQAVMKFWLEFGRDALNIRLETYWLGIQADTEKIQACGWIKCPRFGDRCQDEWGTALLPSYCTRCYKINYCSMACQKLDWTEGNHRHACKSHNLLDSSPP